MAWSCSVLHSLSYLLFRGCVTFVDACQLRHMWDSSLSNLARIYSNYYYYYLIHVYLSLLKMVVFI